tara:strand:- start:250 stop:420 length:171 start_codon:yes stop_codon:yes gene_type:complete
MSKKTFVQTDKKGRTTTWEWEETQEVKDALERLHQPLDSRKVTEEDTLTNLNLGDK